MRSTTVAVVLLTDSYKFFLSFDTHSAHVVDESEKAREYFELRVDWGEADVMRIQYSPWAFSEMTLGKRKKRNRKGTSRKAYFTQSD